MVGLFMASVGTLKEIIMIKLAEGNNKVFASLTINEFKYLARVSSVDDVADGTAIDLVWIKNIIDNVNNFQAELTEAKAAAETLADKLGTMIT